eukprot:CAMPEP_0115109914 /NCGR_PEP_ID=MMETSP0227-20121206/39029_1 /TAXON_ID=89957 /ORGANISM="Polarella glacialis, Strain CCMP 1383" /LENGTH=590 /DNA_ID=CAMNT_0002508783 /DNA_START=133 /DNA_END=1905 /DNA_ORIENTATION=-
MTTSDLDRRLHASVMKREAVKEEEYRRKREAEDEKVHLGFGATEMSPQELRKIVDSDRRMYYRTEELNDKLYIHYKGWKELANLEGWTGLRAIYAECNAFSSISGLSTCTQLRSLFLQENCIRRISGLENCPHLWSLNLNSNYIERIEGLSQCRTLNTLTIAKNKIGFQGVDDLIHLVDTTIGTLDIQDNKIWDPDVVPEVFMRMTDLRVLYLKGNPCSKKIPNYRKGMTALCKDLKYLDDRPVFPEDRRAAEAFNRGGLEEERVERRLIREENNDKHNKNMRAFQDMIDNARKEKREREAMRKEDKFTNETDPVESNEDRMRKQVDKWHKDNAEDLRDTDKERAVRMLKAERERNGGKLDPDSSMEASPPTDDNSKEEAAKEAAKEPAKNEPPERPEDNRKLVYEDIWDDVPMAGGKSTSGGSSGTTAPPPRQPADKVQSSASREVDFEAASQFQGARRGFAFRTGDQGLGYYRDVVSGASAEVFLPWASGEGASGLDSVGQSASTESAVERRVREMQAKLAAGGKAFDPPSRAAAAGSESAGAEDSKPSWHAKYLEKTLEFQEATAAAIEAAARSPADRGGPELGEMD